MPWVPSVTHLSDYQTVTWEVLPSQPSPLEQACHCLMCKWQASTPPTLPKIPCPPSTWSHLPTASPLPCCKAAELSLTESKRFILMREDAIGGQSLAILCAAHLFSAVSWERLWKGCSINTTYKVIVGRKSMRLQHLALPSKVSEACARTKMYV